jgi:hypothetical protein
MTGKGIGLNLSPSDLIGKTKRTRIKERQHWSIY